MKDGEVLASHCVKCCRMLNLCLAFFSSPRNGSVRGKVSLVLNLYGLRTKAALPRTENLRGDEKGQIHCVKFWLFFQSFANRLPIVLQRFADDFPSFDWVGQSAAPPRLYLSSGAPLYFLFYFAAFILL